MGRNFTLARNLQETSALATARSPCRTAIWQLPGKIGGQGLHCSAGSLHLDRERGLCRVGHAVAEAVDDEVVSLWHYVSEPILDYDRLRRPRA